MEVATRKMITVCAYFTPSFHALSEVTVPNIRRYCGRHGYGLVFWSDVDHPEDDTRPFGFRKTERVLELLRASAAGDILCVIDLDLLFTNHTRRLEEFLYHEHDLFFTHDVNGLNSGVYIVRATLGTRKFLEDALARAGLPGVFGEQDAMRDSLKIEAFGNLTKIVPHPAFNSFLYAEYGLTKTREQGQWEPGDFLLHLPGRSNERRIELFTCFEIQREIVE
jgi:hypothetical protein